MTMNSNICWGCGELLPLFDRSVIKMWEQPGGPMTIQYVHRRCKKTIDRLTELRTCLNPDHPEP